MCFKENSTLYKFVNIIFVLYNIALIIACAITISEEDNLIPYYKLEVTHDQFIDVYLIYLAMYMNIAAFIFHGVFGFFAVSILERQFLPFRINSGRWFYQFIIVGFELCVLMAIHGMGHIETFAIAITLFASILVLCYFQDQYINTMHDFNPPTSPHFFAVPLYILFIAFLMIKSMEHIHSLFEGRLAIVTTITLLLTSVFFMIQKIHIYYATSNRSKVDTVDDDKEEEDEENNNNIEFDLDNTLRSQLIDIKFEIFHYINVGLHQLVITWIVIKITRANITLI